MEMTKEYIVREGKRSGGIYPSRCYEQIQELVRCKDCKWYENACTFFAADPFERAPMEKNDFCSYGERRIENLTVKLSKEQPKQMVIDKKI